MKGVLRSAFVTILSVALAACLPLASGAGAAGDSGAGSSSAFVFSGQGRAHGVGLCMDGVYFRAQEGWGYHAIIEYYYTGISYGRTDENQQVRVKCRDGQVRQYSMRDYLYRLQEEPESCPMEELKVLYAAARTYTLSCIARGKHAGEGFDICSSGECCQAFDENKDLSKYPNNCAAVNATAGEIITYGGQPITAAYCGSCGGHTENNEDVWGGSAIPYLRGRPDEFCPRSSRYAWEYSFTQAELEARLNSSAASAIGTLYSIDLSDRTPGGRVRNAVIRGSAGSKTISGGSFASLFGFPSTKFDLAPNNFDEYLLVLNPGDEPATVDYTFMQPDGATTTEQFVVGSNSRYTVKADDFMPNHEFSTRISSNRPVVAERAMYFDYKGRTDGHASTGATALAKKLYLAEGYTAEAFDTYVLVMNPNEGEAELEFTFLTPSGKNVVQAARAPGHSRVTVHVDAVPGLEATDVSTVVECKNGLEIAAERATYFNYNGFDGGSCAQAVEAPAAQWCLPEGYTGGTFSTYILLANPGDTPAEVEATYMIEGGTNRKATYTVAPHSRYTVAVDGIPGMEDAQFSTDLRCTNGGTFIAERAMYFNYRGKDGGHASPGITTPADTFYLAEGYTGDQFDTYVLVQNPSARAAEVNLTFMTQTGTRKELALRIEAGKRHTIHVDDIEGLENAEVSTVVHSTNGVEITAERSMYFDYTGGRGHWMGGTNTTGVGSPATLWYFPEGYTGY